MSRGSRKKKQYLKSRESIRQWNASEKGIAARRRYEKTEKYRERQKEKHPGKTGVSRVAEYMRLLRRQEQLMNSGII
jgi:hypothetical protein